MVFPTPLDSGELTIRPDPTVIGRHSKLSLFDMLGREIVDLTTAIRFDGSGGTAMVERAGLALGIYLVLFRTGGPIWCRNVVMR